MIRYMKAANGHFVYLGKFHGTGGKVSWMPKSKVRIAKSGLFHIQFWSHKRGIHHHLRLGNFEGKWVYWV